MNTDRPIFDLRTPISAAPCAAPLIRVAPDEWALANRQLEATT
jgi:hypothetical protein